MTDQTRPETRPKHGLKKGLKKGRWVNDHGIWRWRAWRPDRHVCGIKDCTAVHVPWNGMTENNTKGA